MSKPESKQTKRRYSGPELTELLERVVAENGHDVSISAVNRIRSGGFAGFFCREEFEVLVEEVGAEAAASGAPENRDQRFRELLEERLADMHVIDRAEVVMPSNSGSRRTRKKAPIGALSLSVEPPVAADDERSGSAPPPNRRIGATVDLTDEDGAGDGAGALDIRNLRPDDGVDIDFTAARLAQGGAAGITPSQPADRPQVEVQGAVEVRSSDDIIDDEREVVDISPPPPQRPRDELTIGIDADRAIDLSEAPTSAPPPTAGPPSTPMSTPTPPQPAPRHLDGPAPGPDLGRAQPDTTPIEVVALNADARPRRAAPPPAPPSPSPSSAGAGPTVAPDDVPMTASTAGGDSITVVEDSVAAEGPATTEAPAMLSASAFWFELERTQRDLDSLLPVPSARTLIVGPLPQALALIQAHRDHYGMAADDIWVLTDRTTVLNAPDWRLVRSGQQLEHQAEQRRGPAIFVVDVPVELPAWVPSLVQRLRRHLGLVRYVVPGEPRPSDLMQYWSSGDDRYAVDLTSSLPPEQVLPLIADGHPITTVAGADVTAELIIAMRDRTGRG